MTIGIYALYWWEQDLVYIGLSQNIEKRNIYHFNKLKQHKHSNYKVQNAYNNYGKPMLLILEECSSIELNDKEVFWTREFDSINNGLNIVEAGCCGGYGTNSPNSTYSTISILRVFSLLYKTKLSYEEISIKTKVSEATIRHIKKSETHTWLKERYPDKYAIMQLSRKSNLGLITLINSYTGKILLLENSITNFIVDNGLAKYNTKEFHLYRKGIGKVINAVKPSYKGWQLK